MAEATIETNDIFERPSLTASRSNLDPHLSDALASTKPGSDGQVSRWRQVIQDCSAAAISKKEYDIRSWIVSTMNSGGGYNSEREMELLSDDPREAPQHSTLTCPSFFPMDDDEVEDDSVTVISYPSALTPSPSLSSFATSPPSSAIVNRYAHHPCCCVFDEEEMVNLPLDRPFTSEWFSSGDELPISDIQDEDEDAMIVLSCADKEKAVLLLQPVCDAYKSQEVSMWYPSEDDSEGMDDSEEDDVKLKKMEISVRNLRNKYSLLCEDEIDAGYFGDYDEEL